MRIKRRHNPHPLNILLTNGRFPVSLDLARQLKRAGHYVYCVDPMEYHVCKFSNAVKKSWEVPVPHSDARGYVEGVLKAIEEAKIDLIIPLHEEVFFLAECNEEEIKKRLFAPPFEVLLLMHNKWEFNQFLNRIGLDSPKSTLCRSLSDVRELLSSVSYDIALKPVFGRSASKVHHLHPGQVISDDTDIDVSPENHYIAQEWLVGRRYCSYSVVRNGRTQAFGLYPVQDTIDGSSCVYFQSGEHAGIREYTENILSAIKKLGYTNVNGQLAYDFIETPDGRLVAIECNPRATSGIHLFSGKARLAKAFTTDLFSNPPSLTDLSITDAGSSSSGSGISESSSSQTPPSSHSTEKSPQSPSQDPSSQIVLVKPNRTRQVAPGMLMSPASSRGRGLRAYLAHQKRLLSTKDVVFTSSDLLPVLMQPFLLTSYYEICRERKMRLADMFQWDVAWEPEGEWLVRVRGVMDEVAGRVVGVFGGEEGREDKETEKEADKNGSPTGQTRPLRSPSNISSKANVSSLNTSNANL